MHAIDWAIVALYVLSAIGIGVYFTKRAANSTAANPRVLPVPPSGKKTRMATRAMAMASAARIRMTRKDDIRLQRTENIKQKTFQQANLEGTGCRKPPGSLQPVLDFPIENSRRQRKATHCYGFGP